MTTAPNCICDNCYNFRQAMIKAGEPLTWKGIRILTEHELSQWDWPYPPEPEPDGE